METLKCCVLNYQLSLFLKECTIEAKKLKKKNSLLVVAVVDCYIRLEGLSAEGPRWHLDTVPGHYWVQQVKDKLVEYHLTSPLMQGMCLVVVTVAAAGTVEAAAVVAKENKTNIITLKPLLHGACNIRPT